MCKCYVIFDAVVRRSLLSVFKRGRATKSFGLAGLSAVCMEKVFGGPHYERQLVKVLTGALRLWTATT